MLVKENLISFQILWKDYIKKAASTQKTKEIFAQWLDNEVMDVCGLAGGAGLTKRTL